MRTYGLVTDPSGVRFWVEVNPDANGMEDQVYLTALIQTLKLNWGESPFFSDWGIPAHQSVAQQIQPDYYVTLTQQRYASRFLSLAISKRANTPGDTTPTYDVSVIFHNGTKVQTIVVPQAWVDGYGRPILDGYGNPLSMGTRTGRFVAA